MLEVPLPDAFEIQGQQLYMAVQANILLNNTGFSLLIDGGSGSFASSSDSDAFAPGSWDTHTFQLPMQSVGPVPVFRQNFALEDAIGSHTCSLEANMRVTNGIPLGSPLPLIVIAIINHVETLKARPGLRCRCGACFWRQQHFHSFGGRQHFRTRDDVFASQAWWVEAVV
jgi:hypothetical protein